MQSPGADRKRLVTFSLTSVSFIVTYSGPRPMIRTPSGRHAGRRGECGTRARTCNPLPGSFGKSARSALRPVREKHRCTETGKLRGKPDGGLIPGSAELKLGSGVRSPEPEPRWNADRWRLAIQARPCPKARQNTNCVCRRFASESFLLFFPFVIAGLDPAIHAEASLARRFPPSVCLLELCMDHWIKSGGDEAESGAIVAFHSSDAQPHREDVSSLRAARSAAKQSSLKRHSGLLRRLRSSQ
jgi:hypothetical protein